MKNLKLIFAGLCWASVISGVSACEMDTQEQEELRVLCAPIIAGQPDSEYPILEEALEKVLLAPFMAQVSSVPKEERVPLVTLVSPWFNMDELNIHELLLRKSVILLTEKLTQVPLLHRDSIMSLLNRIVDLISPGLAVCQNSRPAEKGFCVDKPTHAARHTFWVSVRCVEATYLKSLLELILSEIENTPQDGSSIDFLTKVAMVKKNLGIPE